MSKTQFSSNGATAIAYTYTYDAFDDAIRSQVRITSPGNFVKVDTALGQLMGAGGLNAASMQAPRIPASLTGGKLDIHNIEANFSAPVIAASADGVRAAVGTNPAITYTMRDAEFWTYENISGPGPLPKGFLTRANIQFQLKSAGYLIRSVTADRITFFGVYKISRLRFTPAALDTYLRSFGYLSSWTNGIRHLNQDEPMGLGDMEVSVMLSMPMPAN